jgi:hypothetical protein
MANRTDSRRLDELVKQTLGNYEPADTASDWSKMEAMLGTAPKIVAPSFKLPSLSVSGEGAGFVKGIFSSYIFFVVLMLAGGGYLLYTILKAPKQDAVLTAPLVDSAANKTVTEPPVVLNTAPVENKPVAEIMPEVAKDTVAAANPEPAKEEKKEKVEDPKAEEKETKEAREKREAREAKEKKDAELAEKREKEKREKIEAEKLKTEKKKEEAKKAEKKEKERLATVEKEKKEASKETLKKSNNPVGLNFLRSVNLDSLKKQQSQEQPVQQPVNDTAKGQ